MSDEAGELQPIANQTLPETESVSASQSPKPKSRRQQKNERYSGGKNKKRQRAAEEQAGDEGANKRREVKTRQPRELKEGEEREPRRPKKKVAALIGYCGTGYHGMQVNPPMRTIEGDLFDAFCKAGAISKDNSSDPKKVAFMRAARTDKGVHAAGNVVSLKLIVEDSDIVEKINSYLPDQIRMWGYSLTNKSFECRKMCSSRIYEYLIPSYSFLPPKPSSAFAKKLRQADEEVPGKMVQDAEGATFWEKVEEELTSAGINRSEVEGTGLLDAEFMPLPKEDDGSNNADQPKADDAAVQKVDPEKKQGILAQVKEIKAIENKARRAYRISPERLERVRAAFKLYQGTNNFHNFTIGKHYKDASSMRNMKTLTVSDGKIINGTEWLSIKIHGQSFMLHQIRKMVAMVALVVRFGSSTDIITQAFGPVNISIPKAPSLGLLLEQPVYDAYNKRLSEFGRDHITFEKYEKQIEDFKMKYIYDKIYAEEAKENVFHGFFGFIDCRRDDTFDFLTSHGITDKSQNLPQKLSDEDREELQGDNEG